MRLKLESKETDSWKLTVYYNPEAYGLEKVAELEYSDHCYQFDTRVVWRGKDGRLWTARDSGCSCPLPFEDTKELDRCFMSDLSKEYKEELVKEWGHKPSPDEWRKFRDDIKAALARKS